MLKTVVLFCYTMILIGPGGTEGKGYEKGIPHTKSKGLSLLEVEFTHGVNMSVEKAKIIGKLAKDNEFTLTIHAPYFINLASPEPEKVEASKKRILDSIERAHHMGAKYVVFHAGFYMKRDEKEVYGQIRDNIKDIQSIIKENGWEDVILAPETTGKGTQFGSVTELLKLKEELGIGICVDFSHVYARNNGVIDYKELFRKLPKKFHAHFSGIEYTEKGEKKHLLTTKEFFRPLLQELNKIKNDDSYDITLINESPEPLNDALMMWKELNKI